MGVSILSAKTVVDRLKDYLAETIPVVAPSLPTIRRFYKHPTRSVNDFPSMEIVAIEDWTEPEHSTPGVLNFSIQIRVFSGTGSNVEDSTEAESYDFAKAIRDAIWKDPRLGDTSGQIVDSVPVQAIYADAAEEKRSYTSVLIMIVNIKTQTFTG